VQFKFNVKKTDCAFLFISNK